MDFGGIILRKTNQTKRNRNTIQYFLLVESKKYKKLVNITKKKADSEIQTPNQWLPLEKGKGEWRGA